MLRVTELILKSSIISKEIIANKDYVKLEQVVKSAIALIKEVRK